MVPTLVSLLVAAAAAGVANASPIPRADTQSCWTTYTSLPGDNCGTIAMAFHITTTDVYDANTFLNCDDIWPGTPICVYGKSQVTVTGIPPAGPTTVPGSGTCWANYRSQLGDTCDSIATRFGITPDAVYNANTFLNCNDIWDGTPIVICDGNRTRTTVVNTPTGTGPGVTITASTSCWTTWSREGDTCDTIADRFQITSAEVYNSNTFLNCNDIWPNTPLEVCTHPTRTLVGPTPTATTTISPTLCWTAYSQEGDTCDIIANRLGISSADVWDKNRFVNCNDIWTNTPLVICQPSNPTLAPSPTTTATQACWTVRSVAGDTCSTIGARFGISATEVYNANTFLDCNNIWTNTPVAICSQRAYIPAIIDFLTDLFPTASSTSVSSSSSVEENAAAPTETSTSSSSEAESVVSTSSSSSSEAEYVVPTSSSSSEAEYVVPTSSSSSDAEYVVPTSSTSSSSAEGYIVAPTSTSSSSSAEEYIVAPTSTSSSSAEEYDVPTSTSSSSAIEYVVPR